MRNRTLLTITSLTASLAYIHPAHAQIATVCPTCSQETTTVSQWAKQLLDMAASLQNQYYQLEALKSMFYSNGFGSLSELQQLGSAQALTNGQLSGAIGRLQSGQFPIGQYSSLQGQLQQSNAAVGSQLTALQQLLDRQNRQYGSDANAVQSAQNQAKMTVGTHQALQVSNEFQGQMASSLLKIQQLNAAQAQTMATQVAVQNERQASTDAQAEAMLADPGKVNINDGEGY